MLSRDEGARHRSFDEVIVEIDRLLVAYKEKRKRRKPKVAATPAKAPRKARKRLVWIFLLVAMFVVGVVVYLHYTGNVKIYTDTILVLWDNLISQLGQLFRKQAA